MNNNCLNYQFQNTLIFLFNTNFLDNEYPMKPAHPVTNIFIYVFIFNRVKTKICVVL